MQADCAGSRWTHWQRRRRRAAPTGGSRHLPALLDLLAPCTPNWPRAALPALPRRLAAPAAAVLGAALLFGATPDMAEAARSGGRVGGSSGFSARRAAPPA